MEEGKLPHLSRLIREGVSGVLRSTIQPSSEQAWPSFSTGVNNGKFGIYCYVERRPDSYVFDYINARHLRTRTFWEVLSQRGRRVIVINVPITYPPRPVNGVIIGGLMSPGLDDRFTYPPGLYRELKREVGGYIINVDIERGDLDEAAERELIARTEEMIRLRTETTLYLARTRPWDVLVVVFVALDRLSHKFWKYMDPAHPLYTEEDNTRLGHVIPRAYTLLDEAVGRLVEEIADEDTTVFILSDHGFGPLEKAVFLNKWLAQRGYLAWKEKADPSEAVRAFLRRLARMLDNPLLGWLKGKTLELFPELKGRLHSAMAYARIDWSRTRAYAVGTMGNIYVNLRGREPQGVVEPGREYEELREQLIEELRSLWDEEAKRPVFERVFRREEIYHGPHLELAPDVVGLMDGRYHGAAVDWRGKGDEVIVPLGDELLFIADISGQHRMDGIFIAWGPQVKSGVEIKGARIVDLAPTILHSLGEAVPRYMDGRVLEEIFSTSRPVRFSDEPLSPEGPGSMGSGYTDEEAAEVEKRLQGLGYID